ncbi:MAG: thermonuclease family protein [Alphaproteobacteria bacterium]|nr:thermonuclease family protein [Alphaproteobacteria bacterium]
MLKSFVLAGSLFLASIPILATPATGADFSGEVRIVDGDTLEIGGRRLRLYGIIAPVLDNRCAVAGKTIACGRVSRSALLDLTAGAKVSCDLVKGGTTDEPPAICRAGGYDLSEGMTYTGWARADTETTDAYRRFERDARRHHRGLWRKAVE